MPQKIHNLSKWTLLKEGSGMAFHNPKPRMVDIDVNCPSEVQFWVLETLEDREFDQARVEDLEAGRDVDPIVVDSAPIAPALKKSLAAAPAVDGRAVTFLGLAKGRDRFSFAVSGAFDLVVVGGPAYVYSIDSDDLATRIVAPIIFTRIANRRQRNPQLEMMDYQMRLNSSRMYAALEEESARRIEAVERKLERYVAERNQGTPIGNPRVAKPAPAGGRPASDAPAGEVGEDEGQESAGEKLAGKKAAKPADDKGKAKSPA